MSMQTNQVQVMSTRRQHSRVAQFAGAMTVAVATLAGATSCTNQQMAGQSAAYLTIDALEAASGAEPDKFGTQLASDVQTNNSIFADNGSVSVRTVMKDPGSSSNPSAPSTTNLITINRYHVKFVRADGRNVQGVDVPYEFDGALTFTAQAGGSKSGFTLVRVQAKLESPLMALRGLGGAIAISTLAEVTFFGNDQAGRPVSVTGTISVNFADWGDPKNGG